MKGTFLKNQGKVQLGSYLPQRVIKG